MWMPSQSRSPLASRANDDTVSTVAFCQCESSRIAWYFASTSAGGLPSLALAQMNTDGCERSTRICDRRLSAATRRSSSSHCDHFSHWLQHIQPYISGMPSSSAFSMMCSPGNLPSSRTMLRPRSLTYRRMASSRSGSYGEQQVGRVGRAADQEVAAVDLQIEVAALAQIGKLAVGVAVLGDGPDAEPQVGRIRRLAELAELQIAGRRGRACRGCRATTGRDCRPSARRIGLG